MDTRIYSASLQPGRPLVAIDDLQAGMVLTEDVHDAQGRLLMPRGTELTARHLRAFQLWGILGVPIRGQEGEAPPLPPPSPELLAEAEEQVRARFRHNDLTHPGMVELFRVCILREARRLAIAASGRA